MQTTITFKRLELPDDCQLAPDEQCEGFWPSTDPDDAGYIGASPSTPYAEQFAAARARMDAFERGDWGYIGIRAQATITLASESGNCATIYTLESEGLWGIESDSGEDYLAEVFEEQKVELLADILRISGEVAKAIAA
jgi:hypothetical protein